MASTRSFRFRNDAVSTRLLELSDFLAIHDGRRRDRHDRRSKRQITEDVINDLLYMALKTGRKSCLSISSDNSCLELTDCPRWGYDSQEQNNGYSLRNHDNMMMDHPRVGPYIAAIQRIGAKRRVLDLGSGPYTLLARIAINSMALSVDAVEQNCWAIRHSVGLFDQPFTKTHRQSNEMLEEKQPMAYIASNCVASVIRTDEREQTPGVTTVSFGASPERGSPSRHTKRLKATHLPESYLRIYQGFSNRVSLDGGYDLVVHEILGHVASAEGVVPAILDLRERGLCTSECVFVPRAAYTMISPTSPLHLDSLESIIHCYRNGYQEVVPGTKYHARRFPQAAILSPGQPMEVLEFAKMDSKSVRQRQRCDFEVQKGGLFDGMCLHLDVDMDGISRINTLTSDTSWRCTYVRLLERPLSLVAGAHLVFYCTSVYQRLISRYEVRVFVIDPDGVEREVTDYTWDGTSS